MIVQQIGHLSCTWLTLVSHMGPPNTARSNSRTLLGMAPKLWTPIKQGPGSTWIWVQVSCISERMLSLLDCVSGSISLLFVQKHLWTFFGGGEGWRQGDRFSKVLYSLDFAHHTPLSELVSCFLLVNAEVWGYFTSPFPLVLLAGSSGEILISSRAILSHQSMSHFSVCNL